MKSKCQGCSHFDHCLNVDYHQDTFSNAWFWPKMPHGPAELLDANRDTVRRFTESVEWRDDDGDPRRTADQIHLVAEDVPLRRAYEELLIPLRFIDERDSQLCTGALLQIDDYLQEHPDATCTVYQMNKGRGALRSVNDEQEIPTLFQGANYADRAHRDQVYPGDEHIRGAQGLTIQIHTLEVRQRDRGPLIANRVPAVAMWLPASMGRDWLVQERS